MRLITLLGCCLLSLAAGCFDLPPEEGGGPVPGGPSNDKPAGQREFTLTMSDPRDTNARMGSHRMKIGSGQCAQQACLIMVSSHPASGEDSCLILMLSLAARPEAGGQWPLVRHEGDGGTIPPGTGSLLLQDVCESAGTSGQWVSVSGTVQVDSVTEPEPGTVPDNYPTGMVKVVRLRLTDVAMSPSPKGAPAKGAFTLGGGGLIEPMFIYDMP